MTTWQDRQNTLVDKIKSFYIVMDEKNKRMLTMIPRIAIIMLFSIYFAGIIQHWLDVIMLIIGTIILGVVLFFIPIETLINNKKK